MKLDIELRNGSNFNIAFARGSFDVVLRSPDTEFEILIADWPTTKVTKLYSRTAGLTAPSDRSARTGGTLGLSATRTRGA